MFAADAQLDLAHGLLNLGLFYFGCIMLFQDKARSADEVVKLFVVV